QATRPLRQGLQVEPMFETDYSCSLVRTAPNGGETRSPRIFDPPFPMSRRATAGKSTATGQESPWNVRRDSAGYPLILRSGRSSGALRRDAHAPQYHLDPRRIFVAAAPLHDPNPWRD